MVYILVRTAVLCFFFFSSRRRHTRFDCDWSSDVCSSDLNMRTLDAVRPETRRRVARETLEIYAPIANRLGLDSLFRELQELAFSNLYPGRYKVLAKAVKAARGNRREVVDKILKALKERLQSTEIEAPVTGRGKRIYSI